MSIDSVFVRATFPALALTLAMAAGGAGAAEDPFQRIKALEGTWVGVDAAGQPTDQVVSVFHVTSNGHSVEEIMFPGSPNEMVNMYYRDGDDVLMTHYCAGGNQPTVKLMNTATPGLVKFEYHDISNMITMNDEHMREGSFRWIGEDRLKAEWRSWSNGQYLSTSSFEMVRRK